MPNVCFADICVAVRTSELTSQLNAQVEVSSDLWHIYSGAAGMTLNYAILSLTTSMQDLAMHKAVQT